MGAGIVAPLISFVQIRLGAGHEQARDVVNSSILWYVHDQGIGHFRRFQSVAAHLESSVVLASSMPGFAQRAHGLATSVVELRSDRADGAPQGPGPFHHAPVDRAALERANDVLAAAERHGCTTAVVDVSVETAVLCRLAGLRTVVLRQSGRRSDPGHHLAHDCADVVWVPQHRDLEPHVVASPSTQFTGAFSRYDGDRPTRARARDRVGGRSGRRLVVVLLGSGGTTFPDAAWHEVDGSANVDVTVIGGPTCWSSGSARSIGHVAEPVDHLRAADAVLSAGGWASVHDLASLGVPSALVAEPRPFDEQAVRVEALLRAGLVVGLDGWPTPRELGDVLDACAELEPGRWDSYYDGKGAQRAAEMIEAVHHGSR